MTWHDWLYLAAIGLGIGSEAYWFRRARRAEAEALRWRNATEHCQRALAARTLLADAQDRTVN